MDQHDVTPQQIVVARTVPRIESPGLDIGSDRPKPIAISAIGRT
jgi:xanthine/CO dehydrogenase XdhC/CoxF family maturation factor